MLYITVSYILYIFSKGAAISQDSGRELISNKNEQKHMWACLSPFLATPKYFPTVFDQLGPSPCATKLGSPGVGLFFQTYSPWPWHSLPRFCGSPFVVRLSWAPCPDLQFSGNWPSKCASSGCMTCSGPSTTGIQRPGTAEGDIKLFLKVWTPNRKPRAVSIAHSMGLPRATADFDINRPI